jgi:hypothetical protein
MRTKLIAMIVGVAIVLATATVYTQSAFALGTTGRGGGGPSGPPVLGGGNGVTDGQPEHGLANACLQAHHSPPCGLQITTGDSGGVKG